MAGAGASARAEARGSLATKAAADHNRAVGAVVTWAHMVKLSHSVFALPFAMIATFLAARNIEGRVAPYWGQLALIVVCMVGARSTAMTFNRIADAALDARNPRTAGRPLPAGLLTRRAAWAMLAFSVALFIAGCVGFHTFYDNPWPLRLALPVLAVLCFYSYTKRFTRWSHVYLGAAIGLSPLAAWIAIHPATVGLPAVLLMAAVTCWIGGFDIIYACQDIDVDCREGLHSLPSRVGPAAALWIARGLHAVCVCVLIALGQVSGLGVYYYAGVAAAAVLLLIENCLVHPGDYSRVNLAFFTLNGVVSIVLATAAIVDVVTH